MRVGEGLSTVWHTCVAWHLLARLSVRLTELDQGHPPNPHLDPDPFSISPPHHWLNQTNTA